MSFNSPEIVKNEREREADRRVCVCMCARFYDKDPSSESGSNHLVQPPPYDVIGVFSRDGSRFSVGFGGFFQSNFSFIQLSEFSASFSTFYSLWVGIPYLV